MRHNKQKHDTLIIIVLVVVLARRELRLGEIQWFKAARLGAEPRGSCLITLGGVKFPACKHRCFDNQTKILRC